MERRQWFLLTLLLLLFSVATNSMGAKYYKGLISVPQPTTCVASSFSKTGNDFWSIVSLKLTNQCGMSVDFQNSTITFNNADYLNTPFWGVFDPITYPDNNLQITSQPLCTGQYLASLSIHIPETSDAVSLLPNGQSITLTYGTDKPTFDPLTVNVYLNGTPPNSSGIDLTNTSAQPTGVSQNFAVINIVSGGQTITRAQLPWSGQQQVTGLAPGTYSIAPENVTDAQGNVYQGTAVPNSITLAANQTVPATISYAQVGQFGSIKVQAPPLPDALTGYTDNPQITFTRAGTGATVTTSVPWNATTAVSNLANNVTYSFSTPVINFRNAKCTGTFTPGASTSNSQSPPTTTLVYSCVVVQQDTVTLNVSGLANTTPSVAVTLTPNDGSAPIVQTINLTNGQGTATVNLSDGVVYNVSATSVPGFTVSFNPQPLTARPNAVETVAYQAVSTGRIIGYMAGWKMPPAARDLANAGYTHVLVAFGVFSTSQPGVIVNAFGTINKMYIASMHTAGMKVLLSLGGASTDIANTTVNFHQVLASASSPAAFQQAFVQSVKKFMTDFGFDGIDIDIEEGLNPGGTFTNPTGDIAVLANIINQLHAEVPGILISLAPQSDNIAANSAFTSTRCNYSSLIMQTASALDWVGIQIYNTGCNFGIDGVCYDPANTANPDASVAFATDLLENWPTGTSRNFLPYIGMLTPSQVVLGYPAPNRAGRGDATPVTPIATIKRAIQCLRSNTVGSLSCQTYKPPRAYPTIGGVFEWEISFDENNNFNFAKGLKPCVVNGNCN